MARRRVPTWRAQYEVPADLLRDRDDKRGASVEPEVELEPDSRCGNVTKKAASAKPKVEPQDFSGIMIRAAGEFIFHHDI